MKQIVTLMFAGGIALGLVGSGCATTTAKAPVYTANFPTYIPQGVSLPPAPSWYGNFCGQTVTSSMHSHFGLGTVTYTWLLIQGGPSSGEWVMTEYALNQKFEPKHQQVSD